MTSEVQKTDRITISFDRRLAVRLRKDVQGNDFRSVAALVNTIVADFYGETDGDRLRKLRPSNTPGSIRTANA